LHDLEHARRNISFHSKIRTTDAAFTQMDGGVENLLKIIPREHGLPTHAGCAAYVWTRAIGGPEPLTVLSPPAQSMLRKRSQHPTLMGN
jgi:hypothetical protein